MAKVLPELDGIFIQAVSEVATVNMMYGAGGAGKRCMTFTSSPGFSLMLEGISYMIGAQIPAVFVNVMRGGPGLGNIGPEQADIKLVCRGLGHGNTHAIVLAPATPQEMLDIAMVSFELAFKYRNPVVIVGDGFLGQMTGKVRLPSDMVVPGIPEWAVFGDHSHRGNLICSLNLSEVGLEQDNIRLNEKYERMTAEEQRADLYRCDDADIVLVACNTPAQLAKGAIGELRDKGLKVGLFRPITLWPFPIDALRSVLDRVKRLVVVEASSGQLEDELRLALSHADVHMPPPMSHVRRMGGVLPSQGEIVEHVWLWRRCSDDDVRLLQPVRAPRQRRGGRCSFNDLLPWLRSWPGQKYLAEAIDELGVQDRTVLVSPVGCSVFSTTTSMSGTRRRRTGAPRRWRSATRRRTRTRS